jgi:NAD(P)-dependent dehydrogenase (short-subunit alcohol dehydrogenase family)
MISFARGAKPEKFVGTRYYATTKAFTSWWSAAMARRFGERISIFTVSPGSNLSTNAARHTTGFKRFLFTKLMPAIGPAFGMGQHVSAGAKRYLDVLHGIGGDYVNGKTYTSKPKKLIGPLHEMTHGHLLNVERQETAWSVLGELTGTVDHQASQAAAE